MSNTSHTDRDRERAQIVERMAEQIRAGKLWDSIVRDAYPAALAAGLLTDGVAALSVLYAEAKTLAATPAAEETLDREMLRARQLDEADAAEHKERARLRAMSTSERRAHRARYDHEEA